MDSSDLILLQFFEHFKGTEKEEKFAFLKEFTYDPKTEIKLVQEAFVEYLKKNTTPELFFEVTTELLLFELKTFSPVGIFRNDAVTGIKLVSSLWYDKEGQEFLTFLVPPVVDKVKSALKQKDQPLEIDPDKSKDVKDNLKKVLHICEFFLERLYNSEQFFSVEMKELFRTLETRISLTHPLGGPILVGGLLVLRLLSPALISPQKYKLVSDELSLGVMRTLVLITKVIQNLANGANESENYMKAISWWAKKKIISWRAFFRKLINDKSDDQFQVPSLSAEDLINISNHNLKLESNDIRQTQLDLIRLCLDVEASTEGWKIKKKKGATYYLKFIDEKTCKYISKAECEIKGSIGDVWNHLRENEATKQFNPTLVEHRVIESFNENTSIIYTAHKLPIVKNRDLLYLYYTEYLPDEKIALVCHSSVDRDDVPSKKGFVRATWSGGWIFREISPKITHVVYCFYGDGAARIPKFVIKFVNQIELEKIEILRHRIEKTDFKSLSASNNNSSGSGGKDKSDTVADLDEMLATPTGEEKEALEKEVEEEEKTN